MDTQNGFKKILTAAGFAVKARDAIIEFLCESLTDMANMSIKNLDSGIINLHKVLSNEDTINCNAHLTLVNINAYATDEINHMCTHYLESRKSNELTASLGEVKVPKLTPLKWPNFKSAISECLNCAIGKNNIPLSYVIRKGKVGNFEEYYDTRCEKQISCMSLTGPAFQGDNDGDVFSLLIQHTKNTEGYTIISNNEKKRNIRKAWVELSIHFEGSTFKARVIQEAVTTLKHNSYPGDKLNLTLRDYYTLHARAHAKLLRVDKPMIVEQQIDGFIQGIQCATAQIIVINLAGDQTAHISFDSYYNAVASRLELSLS